jgi:hypothetical protein
MTGKLLRGAKPIAAYVLGDEKFYKSIYGMAAELGLFTFGGLLCGRTDSIDKILAARGEAPASERLSMRAEVCPHREDKRRGRARLRPGRKPQAAKTPEASLNGSAPDMLVKAPR